MESISELAIQEATADLIRSHAPVRSGLLQSAGMAQGQGWISEDTIPVVAQGEWGDDGETDVRVDWVVGGIVQLRLLIEVKLLAAFQAAQGERYQRRALRSREELAGGRVVTVLLAPSSYLGSANPEARFFDTQLSLEQLVAWSEGRTEQKLIQEALRRIEARAPLGAKGLFVDLYNAVAEECAARGNGIRIMNRPTDWMSLAHPILPTGVGLNFRIRHATAELRVLASYRGDRSRLNGDPGRGVVRVERGGEIFLRLPPLGVKPATTEPTDANVGAIVDAMETLLAYWSDVGTQGERGDELSTAVVAPLG